MTTNPAETLARETYSPMVDIEESRDAIIIWADLPGVDENDVHITLEDHVLTLEARVRPDPRRSREPVHREYGEGDYRRQFTISDSVVHDEISAILTNGVLHLRLPKAEPARPRTITVKAT